VQMKGLETQEPKNSNLKEGRTHDPNSTKFVRPCSRASLAGRCHEASLAIMLDMNEMEPWDRDRAEATLATFPLSLPMSMSVTSLYP